MRRKSGTGTVSKRKDGRWEAAAYVNTPAGKKRVRRYKSTRAEAEAVLVELRKKHSSGILTDTRERKLGEYLDYWLATTESRVTINTYISYEATVRIYVKPGLGQKCLTKLAPRDIQLFFDNQLRTGASVRNIQKQKIVLSSALKMAQQEELLERNVARLVKIPKYSPKEVVPWSVDQIGIFLDSAASDPFYPVFMLIVMYGLRESEALGLSWGDVDFDSRVIHVRRQLQFHNKSFYYADLKTQAGRRDLPLTEAIHKILSGIKRVDLEPLPDLVFKTGNGTPIYRRNLLRSFHRIAKNAGLPKSKIHNLRHAAATVYKDIGAPARDTQLLLGHSNIATTQQIYQHSSMENRQVMIELYEQKLAEVRTCSRQIQPSSDINELEIIKNNFGSGGLIQASDLRLMSPVL
jgi:integrase